MIEKTDSKWISLVTVSILGQPPRRVYGKIRLITQVIPSALLKMLFLYLALYNFISHASPVNMEVIALSNRPSSELQPLISPLLDASERIIANGSKLILKASPSRLEELKKLIQKLDVPLFNLSISVLQTRTTTARELNGAIKLELHHPTRYQSNSSAKLRGRFAYTKGLNNSNSSQIINTLEGKPAFIKVGKIHPVKNITLHQSGNNYIGISSNTQFIEATTGVLVTPYLTGNSVRLDIMPWSDRMKNNGIFETQRVYSTIQVNLGQWIEIGSVNQNSQISTVKTLSYSYSTANKNLRVLVKVDKLI